MKVQLIVVQGKPEGKVIPLSLPTFRIGRGETCHLRPTSELVSREHAEFNVTPQSVTVKDLGSRNGTLVNGKAVTGTHELNDRDLVQVGPLTFAVSIQDAPSSATIPAAKPPAAIKSPDDISHDDIESWLVGDAKGPVPERPSSVYGGDTITINAFKDASAEAAAPPTPTAPAPPAPAPAADEADDDEYERLPEGEGDDETEVDEESSDDDTDEEEFIDESNPFYVAKKQMQQQQPQAPAKQVWQDSSAAASDILRKMMERKRRGS
ncbi:MAG: FHA domain-containing protein [Planctomycetota bacterium]|nr:FHA domain-containing protein [Planctomycetota bacterium]